MTGLDRPGLCPGPTRTQRALDPHSWRFLGVFLVRIYQWTLRPVIGANCRFEPSCSEFAVGAFKEHGLLRGGRLAGGRILRCNPWVAGGYDPVPCACAPAGTAN